MIVNQLSYIIKTILFIFTIEIIIRYTTSLTITFNMTENILIGLTFSLLLIYSSKFYKILLLIFLFLAISIQTSYATIYGSWIDPTDLYLLIKNISEVFSLSQGVEITTILKLLFFIILSITFVVYIYKTSPKVKSNWIANILIIVLFLFQPFRDGILKPEKIEKRFTKDTHSILRAFHNVYGLSIAILLAETFHNQLYSDYTHLPYKKSQTKNKPNIFIYFGESLSSKYMNIYGYDKKTTPFLSTLLNNNLYYTLTKETISGAVATMPSTIRFFHMIKQPNGIAQSRTFNTSLFKYAQENNFQTSYITTQAENYISHIYKLISGKYCNNYLSSPLIDSKYNIKDNASDELIFKGLNLLKVKNPFFIVFQPNGSHVPFADKTSQQFKKFGTNSEVQEYENSVYYADYLFGKILNKIKSLSKNKSWVFIITSDHGTYVDNKHITRNRKYPASYMVPGVIITNNKEIYNNYIKPLKKHNYLFHQDISDMVARLIGMNIPLKNTNSGVLFEGMLNGYGVKKVIINDKNINLKSYNQL